MDDEKTITNETTSTTAPTYSKGPPRKRGRPPKKGWDELAVVPEKTPDPNVLALPGQRPGKKHVAVVKNYADDESRAYPSPKDDPVYAAKWNLFVGNVVARQNFKVGHLEQLNLLCDLYVEYEDLKAFVRKHGYTYTVSGKNGVQIKPYPEYLALSRVLSEIRNYSKVLGLLLVKDQKMNEPKKESWD